MGFPAVFDKSGVERDWAWLRATYGNVVYLSKPTYPKFQLIKVEEMEGPALIQVNVLNEVGGAHSGQPVCLSWPTLTQPADYLPYLDPAGMKSPWTNRGIIQYTMGGTTGFGIGADSYIKDPAAGGPYSVFVVSPSTYSDCVTGVGWLAGTNHRGPCRMTFQIVVDDPTLPEPEPEPGDGIDLETLVNAVDDLTAAVISLTETLREGWRLPGT